MQPKQEEKKTETEKNDGDLVLKQIVEKIRESDSILIALSQNPNIDELATAVGLGMFIDKMGKHATAIYSGKTPNVLAFLRPEEQFESNTNGLQDFIIAINKDKADHLRYKLDGDYVKVYITPYRTVISEDDLEFSHGDYNVDLVLALNVESPSMLDAALSEHGKIMHDATIVNITAGVPGKFGEIEWADPSSSSVAEMVAKLLLIMKDDVQIDKEITTAILTGIVAATERFSNKRTRPETMSIASLLMTLGADQQLVAENIMKEEEASRSFEIEREGQKQVEEVSEEKKDDPSASEGVVLNVKETERAQQEAAAQASASAPVEVAAPTIPTGGVNQVAVSATPELIQPEPTKAEIPTTETNVEANGSQPMDVLPPVVEEQQPEVQSESISQAPVGQQVTQPEAVSQIVEAQESPLTSETQVPADSSTPVLPPVMSENVSSVVAPTVSNEVISEINNPVPPKEEMGLIDEKEAEIASLPGVSGKDYGSMIAEALNESGSSEPIKNSGYIGSNPALQAAPGVNEAPEENNVPNLSFDQPVDMSDEMGGNQMKEESYIAGSPMKTLNPVGDTLNTSNESQVETLTSEESGLPMPNDADVLPPPPAPPLDFSENELPEVKAEAASSLPTLSPDIMQQIAPAATETAEPAQEVESPGAFKIPGA